ncbi:MAG: CRP-like cAMP-binding protein [Hyphomicrobiaceae bacterium]|jgi:CRP-like cAMP-binding protein
MSLEVETEQLRAIPLFRDLDAAKCKLVAMSSDRLNYTAGDMVFAQGDTSDSVYFMLNGRIRVTRRRKDIEINLAEMSGGAVLGETGVICGRSRSATITAIEDTTMLRTDAHVFKELLHQVPQVAVALARELADRLDATSDRLFAATHDNV